MSTLEKILSSSSDFYNKLKKDKNGRYKSWEYCYKLFHDSRNKENVDLNNLSLNLAFYLASWGMYRGSSFLLQKDYKIHVQVVEKIIKPEYNSLFGIKCSDFAQNDNLEKMIELGNFISSYYSSIRKSVKEKEIMQDVSNVLVTKILMGTLGCCPAYDRYFKAGLSIEKIGIQRYGKKSIIKLVKFYEANNDALEQARMNMNVEGLIYPQMKLLDMGFWQIGFNADSKKGLQYAH